MGTPKKKIWSVICELNMCAEKWVRVYVKATKPAIAIQRAEAELYRKGYFFVKAVSCKEME